MELPLIGNQIVAHYLGAIQNALKANGRVCRSSLITEDIITTRETSNEKVQCTRQRIVGSIWAFDDKDRPRVKVEVDGDTKSPDTLRVRIVTFTDDQCGAMFRPHQAEEPEFLLQPTRYTDLPKCLEAIKAACTLAINVRS